MLMTPANNTLIDTFFNDPWFIDPWNDKDFKKMEKKLYGKKGKNMMLTDIQEQDDKYLLEMDLPGFSKDEISATLRDGYLTISAEKTVENNKDEKKNYIHKERLTGSCRRSFYVGEVIREEDIKANFKHGILTLEIPKKEAKQVEDEVKRIAIEG